MFYQSYVKIMYFWASSVRLEIGERQENSLRHRRAGSCFPIDTLLQMDWSPQGPAEVCRLCGFLLEIILPLVSSWFLPINNRSSVAIQSPVSNPFLAVWTHSTTKPVKGHKKEQNCHILRVQRLATILEIWQKEVFFGNCSDYWQDRIGGWCKWPPSGFEDKNVKSSTKITWKPLFRSHLFG